MNRFPRQILIDFEGDVFLEELVEQAIDEALKMFDGNYNFMLEFEGNSYGIGSVNLAYFNVEHSKELNVRKLVYENNG